MSIKSLTYRLSLLLAVCALMLTSCGSDDDVVIDDVDGINVGDGLYFTQKGVDPVASQQLVDEVVETDGFQSTTRENFIGNYLWLDAGDYVVYNVVAKAITDSIGGDMTVVVDSVNGVYDDYMLVEGAASGGSPITVSEGGIYKVTHDGMTNEILLYQIESVGVIGGATPGGWGEDQVFTATAEENTWEVQDVEMREGPYKVRFNGRWTINRRTMDDWDPANGYQTFTNFGNTLEQAEIGGSDIQIAEGEEGIYTFTAKWTADDGWEFSKVKTGDVQVITWDAADFPWGIIGDATPNGWGEDFDMTYAGEDSGTHSWTLDNFALTGGGAFKFRIDDTWNPQLNFSNITLTGDTDDLSDGGPGDHNILVANDGNYNITVSTSDEGDTYTVNFEKL